MVRRPPLRLAGAFLAVLLLLFAGVLAWVFHFGIPAGLLAYGLKGFIRYESSRITDRSTLSLKRGQLRLAEGRLIDFDQLELGVLRPAFREGRLGWGLERVTWRVASSRELDLSALDTALGMELPPLRVGQMRVEASNEGRVSFGSNGGIRFRFRGGFSVDGLTVDGKAFRWASMSADLNSFSIAIDSFGTIRIGRAHIAGSNTFELKLADLIFHAPGMDLAAEKAAASHLAFASNQISLGTVAVSNARGDFSVPLRIPSIPPAIHASAVRLSRPPGAADEVPAIHASIASVSLHRAALRFFWPTGAGMLVEVNEAKYESMKTNHMEDTRNAFRVTAQGIVQGAAAFRLFTAGDEVARVWKLSAGSFPFSVFSPIARQAMGWQFRSGDCLGLELSASRRGERLSGEMEFHFRDLSVDQADGTPVALLRRNHLKGQGALPGVLDARRRPGQDETTFLAEAIGLELLRMARRY